MARKYPYPIVDVWANPIFGQTLSTKLPEVSRLFAQSHVPASLIANQPTPAELVKMMDDAGVHQICLSAWYRPGLAVFSNDQVAEYTRACPERIFGVGGVDLLDPVAAVKEVERCVRELGFVGLRVLPWLWDLPPTDAHYFPLFVKCIELDIPFLTQVGHTGPLCPSEPGRPIPYVDAVALKFPQLKIICGHVGYPWTAEMVAVAWKHENVYIDTSAWRPRYLPKELLVFANTTGRDRVMFGTNFPQLGWDVCAKDVQHLVESGELRSESLEAFFGGNARRVLKLPRGKTKASL